MSQRVIQHQLYRGKDERRLVVNAARDTDGKVDITIDEVIATYQRAPKANLEAPLHHFTTTAEACSWNVYSHTSDKQPIGRSNRPPPFDISQDSRAIRFGSQIFLPNGCGDDDETKHFSPQNMSLCLDHIEMHGRYLFVTSRHKLMTIPEQEDKTQHATGKTEVATENRDLSKSSQNSDIDSDSSSGAADTDSTSSIADELSASESWSEASTDLEEEGIRRVADVKTLPVDPALKHNASDASADASSSDGEESNNQHACCSSQVSDSESSVIATNDHNGGAGLSSEEEEKMYDEIYENDRIEQPRMSDSEDNDDYMPDDVWEDIGYRVFGNDEDFDGFQAFESDSDDCSECGEDGGKACELPGTKGLAAAAAGAGDEEKEDPFSVPMAQVSVYDISRWEVVKHDGKELHMPRRVFRYSASTANSLHGSPPAIHPKKPLLVWPLGDGKILFADYRWNTYFMKRLRLSRMFSQHASVQCRMSRDGRLLHIAALEKRGRPPVRPKKAKAIMATATGKNSKENDIRKQDVDFYDLVVSTYRLSKGKTARAPPVLVLQVKAELGSIGRKTALPTYAWTDNELHVAWISDRAVKIGAIELLDKQNSGGLPQKDNTIFETLPITFADGEAPGWAYYYPGSRETESEDLVVAVQQPSSKRLAKDLKDMTVDLRVEEDQDREQMMVELRRSCSIWSRRRGQSHWASLAE